MTDERACEHAIGLWQVKKEVPVADDSGRAALDTYIFAFDGDTVTLRLMSPIRGQWKSEDDFYRLGAECRADVLYYRPPFADWVELATFEDGLFVQVGSGRKRIFERIGQQKVADWNHAILEPREPHDYRIRPDGTLIPDEKK
jgi:hypothetical protein